MATGLEALAAVDYLGKFILFGMNPDGEKTVVYGITSTDQRGRAQQFTQKSLQRGGVMLVEPTGQGVDDTDSHPAIFYDGYGIAVGSSPHVTDIFPDNVTQPAWYVVGKSQKRWACGPSRTPLISGYMPVGPVSDAALGIIKGFYDWGTAKGVVRVPLSPGKGAFIAMYDGGIRGPLRPFQGEPREVGVERCSPRDIASEVYDTLCQGGSGDFGVAVAAVCFNQQTGYKTAIINEKK